MATRLVAGRYRLLREIGRGGMATVYLATDEKHHRDVALKLFRADLAARVGADRFLREIEITAALNHPHILPLLDSGEDAASLFYVMPHVTGGSLRSLLRAGPLPLEAALRIVREVAAALDHAHGRGVVHRDIKPENILFNEGIAVVSDFGIARALDTGAAARMTGTGLSIGTLGYMSPEQALGTAAVDARSDVYALGSVLFEMLVGATPAAWPDSEDVRLGRFADLPASQRERLDALPGRVEQVLVRALALRPQQRFATAGELASALASACERSPRFSDEQVRALLQRAAELDAAAAEPEGALTIGAVEQIAAQAGIPPVAVRRAASALAPSSPKSVASRGAETGARWNRLVTTRSLAGEVPEGTFVAMADEIQRRLDIVGHASIVGNVLTWSPAAQGEEGRKVVVQVTARDGRTSILVREDLELSGARKAVYPAGSLLGALLGLGLSHLAGITDPAALVFVLPLAAGGVMTAMRAVTGMDAAAREPQLAELADALLELGLAAVEPPRALPREPVAESVTEP